MKIKGNCKDCKWCTQKYNVNYGNAQQRKVDLISKPVIQKTKSGEVVAVYSSRSEAERKTGISNGLICNCASGRRKSAGGFIWANI